METRIQLVPSETDALEALRVSLGGAGTPLTAEEVFRRMLAHYAAGRLGVYDCGHERGEALGATGAEREAAEARAVDVQRAAYRLYRVCAARDAAGDGDGFPDLLAPLSAETEALREKCAEYLVGRDAADAELVASADSAQTARRDPPAGSSAVFAAGWRDRMGADQQPPVAAEADLPGLVAWADGYLTHMVEAPPMWGSPEAVEMQVLLLAEVREYGLGGRPGAVFDRYQAFLVRRFPRQPRRPLFELVGEDDAEYSKLAAALGDFLAEERGS